MRCNAKLNLDVPVLTMEPKNYAIPQPIQGVTMHEEQLDDLMDSVYDMYTILSKYKEILDECKVSANPTKQITASSLRKLHVNYTMFVDTINKLSFG